MNSQLRVAGIPLCSILVAPLMRFGARIAKMKDGIQHFNQDEYSRILDQNHARARKLSQTECEGILIDAGASYQQAKNGSYVYLHHGNHLIAKV